MKGLGSILVSLIIFTQAHAQDLVKLPDIAPNIEDQQSQEEVEFQEQQILQDFGRQEPSILEIESMEIPRAYNHIDPMGQIPNNLLRRALNFYDQYKQNFSNQRYITVVDFSKRSNNKRLFVINMSSGQVYGFRTAHGSGSDVDNDGYVESVSNVNNSHQSSKGFYKVSEIYYGKYGRSIRLDGLSSTNSRVRSRAIVIHGSDYVREANVLQGRSWGCFALSWSVKDDIVDLINGGSLMYADFSSQY